MKSDEVRKLIAGTRLTLARPEKRPDRDRERQLALDAAALADLAEKQAKELDRIYALRDEVGHDSSEECPLWYDGCHCLDSINYWKDLAEKQTAVVELSERIGEAMEWSAREIDYPGVTHLLEALRAAIKALESR